MPGLVGIIEKAPSEDHAPALQKMLKSMVREEFDLAGNYAERRLGLSVGWTCHKGSFSDGLPIWNKTKDVCLIFVGEDMKDRSAEYLVHAYESDGLGFIDKINGGFSGVLLDLRQGRLFLFNDRFGLCRIYSYIDDKAFYFSSEAKSLLKGVPRLGQIDDHGLAEFFASGFIQGNKTLFRGVSLIPEGSLWEFFPDGTIQKASYVLAKAREEEPLLSEPEFYQRLEETWARVLRKHFPRDMKTSVVLNGEVSSRMIMAWAPNPPYRTPCLSFGNPYCDSADLEIARQTAQVCQQHHTAIEIKRNFFNDFPALAKKAVIYTDGTIGVWGAVDIYLYKQAREVAPVCVTGDFGDLVLGRSKDLDLPNLSEALFDTEFYRKMEESRDSQNGANDMNALPFVTASRAICRNAPQATLRNTQLSLCQPFLDLELLSLVRRAPAGILESPEFARRFVCDGLPALGRLRAGKRLQGRLARHKHVFSSVRMRGSGLEERSLGHFRAWYGDGLAKYVKDILMDSRTLERPYLKKRGIERIVEGHIADQGDFTREIHRLLSMEMVQRHIVRAVDA